jgi:BirA family transcriptional regulator, biotin operon repressor / biotin---[acetyl-CoA-carboxylase] ligase
MSESRLDYDLLKSRLLHLPVAEIQYLPSTGSTNDDALNWINNGAADGSLVIADEQTAGRGRMQRTWVTRKGSALAFSLIFKPRETNGLSLYAPLGALGVAMALEKLTGAHPQIKWPNDVLVNGKKVCGILTEANWQEGRLAGVVLGIGINVASTAVRLEDNFLFPADSLENSLGIRIDRLELLAETIRLIFLWQQKLGSDEFIQEWNQRLAFRGERVEINCPGQEVVSGIILHIAQDGLLWIRRDNGEEVPVLAGDVSLGTH